MARRVRRPKKKSDILNRLTDRDENGPFGSHVDVMFFAAALGAYHDRKEEFEENLDPMVLELFTKTQARDAMFYMLPIHDQADLSLLRDSEEALDQRVQIFEEYANGGLSLIQERLSATGQTPENVVYELMHEAHRNREDAEDINLKDIADEFGFEEKEAS